MADEKIYQSIDKFYEIAKEEYTVQRNRLYKLEDKTKFLISLLIPTFTFEFTNLCKLSGASESDFLDNIKNLWILMLYFLSIASMLLAIILLFIIIIIMGFKNEIVKIDELYDRKLYLEDPKVFMGYYINRCSKCIKHNSKKLNKQYKLLNLAIFFSVISIAAFCFFYFWGGF